MQIVEGQRNGAIRRALILGLVYCAILLVAGLPLTAQAQQSPAPAAAARLAPGKSFQDCANCPMMVTLADGMAIGRFTVTRGEFAAFANETKFDGKGCYQMQPNGKDWLLDEKADWKSPGFAQTERHPAVCVSWNDAIHYVEWLSAKTGQEYRLPTLEESVAAAVAGGASEFAFGANPTAICQYANVGDASYGKAFPNDSRPHQSCNDNFAYTAPVGSFKPNKFGLYDMTGNVWQWTNSCMKGDCSNAIFRGGAWNDTDLENFRVRHSWGDRVQVRSFALGFRVLRGAAK
jgi:formylglycine-generating enzyme